MFLDDTRRRNGIEDIDISEDPAYKARLELFRNFQELVPEAIKFVPFHNSVHLLSEQ